MISPGDERGHAKTSILDFILHKDAVRTVIPALLLSFLDWKRLCCRYVDAIVKRTARGVSACLEVRDCFITSENGPGHREDGLNRLYQAVPGNVHVDRGC